MVGRFFVYFHTILTVEQDLIGTIYVVGSFVRSFLSFVVKLCNLVRSYFFEKLLELKMTYCCTLTLSICIIIEMEDMFCIDLNKQNKNEPKTVKLFVHQF